MAAIGRISGERIITIMGENSCEIQVVVTGRLPGSAPRQAPRGRYERRGEERREDRRGSQPRERVGRGYNLENNILSAEACIKFPVSPGNLESDRDRRQERQKEERKERDRERPPRVLNQKYNLPVNSSARY